MNLIIGLLYFQLPILYIEDITCLRMDMNFIFECSTRYLSNEDKIHIHKRACNILFII